MIKIIIYYVVAFVVLMEKRKLGFLVGDLHFQKNKICVDCEAEERNF